ncbi:penicillin-binding protein 1B [Pseudoxanthomonas indica]|uniref:Penicillin-binding protein 1B n=1 Tax=Pseudoxanthomonas indica TaxID=428993 RepID=A0A1T5LIH7_9GAMM|nr:penicillin-binding protein 1B [Pseudoxanthomonas indica]GGD35374.1 penicillin-binding protein 1B [Pseudoxanthomonas indica]SKC75469.1 penicillin-binding protein 1B [Pseudoxanthomonas indica]
MAQTDYEDEDDDAYDDDSTDTPVWRQWLLTWGLAAVALGLGFLIPYTLYLNHQVTQRFGELRWQVPTRVYARPLAVAPGVAMDAQTLKTELDAASYRDDGKGELPGTYARNGGRYTIANRGYTDVDGIVAPRRLQVTLSSGRVLTVRDVARKQNLKAARLDPARIATLYGQKQEERRLVRLKEVPILLVTGLQAVEDRDFKDHHGIDLSGIARAVWVTLRSGGETRQGASTLTQQLARSGLLGIGKEVTPSRKFNEILFALILEARYDKSTILEAYFNQVYLGQRGSQAIHGVAAGSEFWFGRDLNALTSEQIALLIGMVKGPSYYDPRRNPERAKERRDFVLGKLHASNLIDDKEYKRAVAAPLGVTQTPGMVAANRFPAYVDLVRRQLARDYPENVLQGAGLIVLTGMSPSAQAYSEGAVTRTIKALENKRRPPLQAGMVVTDVHNGDVLAVVGGRDVANPGFNRAVEAQRPVGSLLKPFVYLLALAQPDQYSLASWVDDSPVTVQLGRNKKWSPGNSDNRSHGTVRLIDALANSYNQATVRVGMKVDPERLAELLRVLAGMQAEKNPSLILGSTDQSPYAMAQLYQFLASGGEIQPLHAVRGVMDPNGKLLKRYDKTPAPAQEGDSIAANLISVALQQVVSNGTARQLLGDGRGHLQSAGKTGTSNDGRDSWYAGYTGDHLAVVWMGNDKNEQTGLYGATGGMRVWSNLFARLPSTPLKVSGKGLDWQWVAGNNSTDPGCPGARTLPFVAGYAPPYSACVMETPAPAEEESGGWRSWFGLDKKNEEAPPASDAPPPPPSN